MQQNTPEPVKEIEYGKFLRIPAHEKGFLMLLSRNTDAYIARIDGNLFFVSGAKAKSRTSLLNRKNGIHVELLEPEYFAFVQNGQKAYVSKLQAIIDSRAEKYRAAREKRAKEEKAKKIQKKI